MTLTCFCENTFEAVIPDEFDASTDPNLPESILKGTFQNTVCPECGKVLKPEIRSKISSLPGIGLLVFLPELDRASYLDGRLGVDKADRVAIGYRELYEKVLLSKDGLDDRCIEIMKYHALENRQGSDSLSLYYHGKDGDTLVFYVYGLKQDGIGIMKLPSSLYEKAAADLKAHFSDYEPFLAPPYVSVKRVDFEDET